MGVDSESIMAENARLKQALHDEDRAWKERIEEKVDHICSACGTCGTTIADLKKTVYGNGTPGLKETVTELRDVVLGRDSKDEGLRGKVDKLSTAYQHARGGWKLLVLESGILVALTTIALGLWHSETAKPVQAAQPTTTTTAQPPGPTHP